MKRPLVFLGVAAAAGVILWQLFARSGAPAAPVRRPDVVLITIDTLRADRIGRGLTPAIDRLAASGRSYPGIRATAPLTLPSHVSLMTGTIPPVHGVRENGVVFDRKRPTIARVFREAGYRTGAFVGAYVLNRRFGLDDGFEVYDDAVPRDPKRSEVLEAERRGGAVVDAAVAWLASGPSDGRPTFLWVHLYDPHAPYAPPEELRGAGDHPYDGEVAYADVQVARLVQAIEQRAPGQSVIAITGDHGESLGAHGERTHGMLVYESAVKVPLVIGGAAGLPGEIACHQGVAPALLRMAGLAARVPPEMAAAADCPSYSETRYPRRAGWHALTSLSDHRWKLILSSEQELYDVPSDPGETRNLASLNANIVQAMTASLARMQPQQDRASAVAPEAAERLRALGYASGSAAMVSDDRAAPNPAAVIAAWTRFEEALGLLHEDRAADALPILKALVKEHPGAPVFHSTFAQALRETGDPAAAAAASRAAVARWPADPVLFHDLAAAAREAGDLREAFRAEQAALALDASSPMAQNGLGLLHADAGRNGEAVAAFTRATQADPTNPSYWTNLGNAQRDGGNAAAAEAAYRTALEQHAAYADALNGLGVLAVQSGRAQDAVALFERALRSDPELHEARLNLGIAYQESGETARAAETYRELLTKAPSHYTRERSAAAELLKALR